MSDQIWSQQQKPREKLIECGASALTDTELLAIFLRTGIKGQSAINLSTQLLENFGSLNAIFNAQFEDFSAIKGIGAAKYVQFQAAIEVSKRTLSETMMKSNVLDSPNAVRNYLHQALKNETYEKFLVIHLDNQHRVINLEELFSGTIDSAMVYPRVIIDSVIKHKSCAVIFAHNHPSGHAEPSQDDIQLTKRLKQVLSLIDVNTLDHLIIGHQEVISLAELGLV